MSSGGAAYDLLAQPDPYVVSVGASSANPGRSGWGLVVRRGAQLAELSGVLPDGDYEEALAGAFARALNLLAKKSEGAVVVVDGLAIAALAHPPAGVERDVTARARGLLEAHNAARPAEARCVVQTPLRGAGREGIDRARALAIRAAFGK